MRAGFSNPWKIGFLFVQGSEKMAPSSMNRPFPTWLATLALAAASLGLAACTVKLPEEQEETEVPMEKQVQQSFTEPEGPAGEPATPRPTVDIKAPPILRAQGTQIVDPDGTPVILKGCNLGNWLLLEMWMLDLRGIRDQYEFESILTQRFGDAEMERLMEIYRSSWIQEHDFEVVRSFGFNVVRLPFNYRLLEDDARPFQLRENAFKWLDAAIRMAQGSGLYVILDMHGVAGGQSDDHTTGRAGQNKLWSSKENQQRFAWLWKEIANRYKTSSTVAAYDIINEPYGVKTADDEKVLVEVADLAYKSIRSVDTNHIIFFPATLKGFSFYGAPADHGWENVGYTAHHYPGLFGDDPTIEAHGKFISRVIPAQDALMRKAQAPFLIGEFNVVKRDLGGPGLMRAYYDIYGRKGWAATMWSYKLVNTRGGEHEDSWSMVRNLQPAPPFFPRTSSKDEIESYLRWLGSMEYSYYRNLGAALTQPEPPPVNLPITTNLHTTAPATDLLPGWQGQDIGNALPGGQKIKSSSAMDTYGGGQDIFGTSDQFRFVSRKVSGDFELTATIQTLTDAHQYSKAGLMIRATADPDSPHVLLNIFPDGAVLLAWRDEKGGGTEQKVLDTLMFPITLRIRRRGEMLEAAYSSTELEWKKAKVHLAPALGREVLTGFAVLSHDNNLLTTASWTDIRFSLGATGP